MHTLISIPPSHYVERARWALDVGGIQYMEQQWPPMLHWIGTFTAGAKRTVPALVLPKKPVTATHSSHRHKQHAANILTDSADILMYVNDQLSAEVSLYPVQSEQRSEVERIERLCSDKLGRYTRVLVYSGLIPNGKAVRAVLATGQDAMPLWRRNLFSLLSAPIISALHKAFVRNPGYVTLNLDKTRAVFAELSELLVAKEKAWDSKIATIPHSMSATNNHTPGAENGKIPQPNQAAMGPLEGQEVQHLHSTPINTHSNPTITADCVYLVGDRFSAADLTFASLAAPVLFPPEYGASLCDLTDLDPDFQKIVAELRATVAGQHALRMYRLHRRTGLLCGNTATDLVMQRTAHSSRM